MTEPGKIISAADLTKAAFSGVLAALEERKIQPHEFPGPILAGVIAWPELSQFRGRAAESLAAAPREET